MKKLVIMLGAFALLLAMIAVPVAAADWSNGNWITDDKTNEYYGVAEVKYDPVTEVTSKYRPIVNDDPDRSTYGWVQFVLLAGGNTLPGSRVAYVRNLKDHKVLPFNPVYSPSGSPLEYNPNPGWLQVDIQPYGMSDIKDGLLGDGRYEGCIADGNNGQPECQEFDIGNADVKQVLFLGHAVSQGSSGSVCNPMVSIKEASYCAESEPAVTHEEYRYVITPAVPPTPESYTYVGHNHDGDYDWHNGESAYYEIVMSGSYDGKCKIVAGWEPYDFAIGMVHYKINSSGPLKYRHHAATPGHYEYVGHHHGDYSYTPANPGHDAVWSSWSVNLPPAGSVSESRTITDIQAKQGGCASGVKESLQSAVSQGYSSVKFDNTKNPGGIFNPAGDLLLSQITDPAYGIVKMVTITYSKGCGSGDKTVTGMEGTVISLS